LLEITDINEAKSVMGKAALLVTMYTSLSWTQREAKFSGKTAEFSEFVRGTITVSWFGDEDWEKLKQHTAVKPIKTRRYDLDELLRRTVIANKP
jgi:hypothetical protein